MHIENQNADLWGLWGGCERTPCTPPGYGPGEKPYKPIWTKNSFHVVFLLTILLDKLNYYGFRGIVNQWFSSYSSNRTQSTEIGSHISSKLNINCGVPHGSVLGPLLFLLYINDIQYCSSKLQFFLFADDTNALYAHKDLKTLELTVNAELHNLYNWLTSHKLSLNNKKANYLCNFSSIPKKTQL